MKLFTWQGWRWALLLTALVAVWAQMAQAQAQQQQNYTGDGGKDISLTIYVPQSTGLAKEQGYIPALVQGEFVSNFSNYSAVSILDWERLDDLYIKLVDEAYDNKAAAKQDVVLGRLAPTSHFLTGNITKTKTGYNIKMNITATADKMTVATYSGTFTFAELDNLTGIRRASLELLQKVGVELTDKARQELAGAAEANQISAQTALAKGVTAQRAGTQVAALSYYYQAAGFNPALKEAVKRSSVMAANITSGNIGADIRNDILWRKNWVAKLKETEEAFYEMINSADPPYTLYYSTDIQTKKVNYQTETADLSVFIDLSANWTWFIAMRRALEAAQAVLDGLNATKRKEDWGLKDWPYSTGVSNINPFYSKTKYDITVIFELVNQQKRVIGNQTVKLNPDFRITRNDYDNDRIIINFDENTLSTVNFNGIKANDISDNLTIRIASVNGASPQKVRFRITAIPVENPQPLIDTRDGKIYKTVRMGSRTWMAENMNYESQSDISWCYKNDSSNCDKYGRLYDWNTAMKICPEGWHLSSGGDWENFEKLPGSRMPALLGGVRSTNGYFSNVEKTGYWWLDEESRRDENSRMELPAGFWFMRSDGIDKGIGMSVRCVKND